MVARVIKPRADVEALLTNLKQLLQTLKCLVVTNVINAKIRDDANAFRPESAKESSEALFLVARPVYYFAVKNRRKKLNNVSHVIARASGASRKYGR